MDDSLRALITGSTRRLGRCIAEGLIKKGCDVALHVRRDNEEVRSLIELADRHNVKAEVFPCDFSNPEWIEPFFKDVTARFGPLNVLINNASIFERADPASTGLELWQNHLNINLTAPVILSQEFLRQIPRQQCSIVNILDWRHDRPDPNHFAYSITKSALASATRMLAKWAAPLARVNAVALGAILPPENEPFTDEKVLRFVPMKRWGTPEEVFQTVWFLISGPQYITGEIITLDGGRQLY